MRGIRAALLGLVAVALSVPTFSAERELRMGPRDIPSKIRAAAEGAVPGIELDAVKLERTKAGFVYEVGGAVEGKRYELEITKDGEVLEVEEDDGIALSAVPEAVRNAALRALPGAKLVAAELTPSKLGEQIYELEATKDGKEYEIRVTAKGEVKSVKEDSEDDDEEDDDS